MKFVTKTITPSHKQEIMEKAIEVAKQYRSSELSDLQVENRFNDLWKSWSEKLIAASSKPSSNVRTDVEEVMVEMMRRDGKQIFMANTKCTWSEVITKQNITSEHVKPKGWYERLKKNLFHFKEKHAREAADKANEIMKLVMKEADSICTQDSKFDKHHAKQVLGLAMELIKQHNKNANERLSFTPTFSGIFLRHIVNYVVPKFTNMNHKYEEKHGVTAKLSAYKQRVFKSSKKCSERCCA